MLFLVCACLPLVGCIYRLPSIVPFSDSSMLCWSNFSRGSYRFTQNLLQLELASAPLQLLPYGSSIASPLHLEAWERVLHSIPDKAFSAFLLRGLASGFCIGESHLVQTCCNRSSAYERPDVISAYLACEVDLGHMAQLLATPASVPPFLQLSPFGIIPKKTGLINGC